MIKADLRKCIEGFEKLTDAEWTLIDATFERAVAEKNDFFLTKGEVADKICFVEQGSLYSFMTGTHSRFAKEKNGQGPKDCRDRPRKRLRANLCGLGWKRGSLEGTR